MSPSLSQTFESAGAPDDVSTANRTDGYSATNTSLPDTAFDYASVVAGKPRPREDMQTTKSPSTTTEAESILLWMLMTVSRLSSIESEGNSGLRSSNGCEANLVGAFCVRRYDYAPNSRRPVLVCDL